MKFMLLFTYSKDIKYKKMEIEGPNYYRENGQGHMSMMELPDELQAQIFRRVRKDTLRNLRLTCKTVKVLFKFTFLEI